MIQFYTTHQKTLYAQSSYKLPITYTTKSRCDSMLLQYMQGIYVLANLPNPSLKRITQQRNTSAPFLV